MRITKGMDDGSQFFFAQENTKGMAPNSCGREEEERKGKEGLKGADNLRPTFRSSSIASTAIILAVGLM